MLGGLVHQEPTGLTLIMSGKCELGHGMGGSYELDQENWLVLVTTDGVVAIYDKLIHCPP